MAQDSQTSLAHQTGKSFAEQHGHTHTGDAITIEPAPNQGGTVIDRQAGTSTTKQPRYQLPMFQPKNQPRESEA